MNDKIYQKLNSIDNLNDRLLLKKVLNGVFISLEEYSKSRYDDLEKRVFSEIECSKGNYNVYSNIQKRQEIDPTNQFLCPILPEDMEEKVYDPKIILKYLIKNKEVLMFKVFLECDYLIYRDIIREEKIFKGTIETEERSYEANFTLKKNTEYLAKVTQLYKNFIDNNVPWSTLNIPYISKIADVVLLSCEEEIKEPINKIYVDFGEYTKFVIYDMIPLWNVKKLLLKSTGFPMPCEDTINYEHVISLEKYGAQHGYLVQNSMCQMRYGIHTRDSLIISSADAESKIWNVCQVISPCSARMEKYNYDIMSNARNSSFINSFAAKNFSNIKTKAELIRIINSFEVSNHLEFHYLKLVNKSIKMDVETYDMNYFIIDEIREDNIKKVLKLYFKAKDKNYYLTRDILSFLVSEIQLLYPEYKCMGILI
ncbi:normocyte-binding protein [Clostridium estertheticum]|uniref:Normocyte-binding protein n=1 Tax=Clostridium estertheticum TaxID=238834 RepID=A0A5N7IMS9_9CLOT|nr:normocyte-binding protein [Clostridium estertheticum]MPQ31619.1 normocyte-binding protein [Clostridium estertheticum]MPQ62292.1 normocyte-binding protein [Clostridium estertheticum]